MVLHHGITLRGQQLRILKMSALPLHRLQCVSLYGWLQGPLAHLPLHAQLCGPLAHQCACLA